MQCLLAYASRPNCPFWNLSSNWQCLLCKWVKECAMCVIITKTFIWKIATLPSLSFSSTIAACHSALSLGLFKNMCRAVLKKYSQCIELQQSQSVLCSTLIPYVLKLHQIKPKGQLKNKSKIVIWHETDLEISPSFVLFWFLNQIQFPFQLNKPIQETAQSEYCRSYSEIFSVTLFSKNQYKTLPPNTASFFFLKA